MFGKWRENIEIQTLRQLGLDVYRSKFVTKVPLEINGFQHSLYLNLDKDVYMISGFSLLVFPQGQAPRGVEKGLIKRNRKLQGFAWQFWPCEKQDCFGVCGTIPIRNLTAPRLDDLMFAMYQELERCRQVFEFVKFQFNARKRRGQA